MQKDLFGNKILTFKEARDLDKFYTKKEVVKRILSKINFNKYDFIIEPSAGDGSFSNQIKHTNLISIDKEPESKKIIKKDWFEYNIPEHFKNVLVIGNPPFGNRNELSKKFIQHSMSFSNVKTIAFILPNVYKKHTLQKIIPNNWRIKKIIDLENNSFEICGQAYHVPCSFFVFDKSKGKDLRLNPDKYKEANDFFWGNKNSFDIFIFGAAPKKMITDKPNKNNRGYYIKSKIKINDLIKKIKNIDWEGNSSVNGGVAWFTKTEIIKNYNEEYDK